jgi:hypothetical protein
MGCFHDRRKERELYEKPTDEKLDNAEIFKKEGKFPFKIDKETMRSNKKIMKKLVIYIKK